MVQEDEQDWSEFLEAKRKKMKLKFWLKMERGWPAKRRRKIGTFLANWEMKYTAKGKKKERK